MTKADRKKVIAARAQATAEQPTYATYWLTRDRRGALSEDVKVWLVRPTRVKTLTGDHVWLALMPDGKTALYGTWTIGMCLVECRVYPDDDLMCIRVGHEPVAVAVVS